MTTLSRSFFTTVIFSLLAGAISAAPAFVPPSEAASPFRRDRLPIDTDTIASLSDTMALLSQGAAMDEASQRRSAAQALALAIALNPANSSARNILSSIAENKQLDDLNAERLDHLTAKVWKLNDWLSTPEAGNDGNILANLLGDTAAALDPEHPLASEWIKTGERGKWDDWVAPLSAFEKPKAIIPPVIANNHPENKSDTDPSKTPPKGKHSSALKSTNATIKAVLHEYQPSTNSYILGPVIVSMEETPQPDEERTTGGENGKTLNITVPCLKSVQDDVSQNVTSPILKALASANHIQIEALPKSHLRISIGKAGNYSFRRNGGDLSGPGFILANAALTGIAPDAIFIGNLDQEGKNLELPPSFWRKLSTLIEGDGGRLVIPPAAEEYMTALLTLEKPEFFMKYEVLIASSPKEAIRLCAMTPDPELAGTLAKFQEIKDKSSSAALGPYLANIHVRKRLLEIAQAAPYHLSAKLLAIQGAGDRPRYIVNKILAAEIFETIDPLNPFSELEIWELTEEKIQAIDKAMEEAREHLGLIERYAEIRDRELIALAENTIAELRTMIRIFNDRRQPWEKSADLARAYDTFRHANRELRNNLELLARDSD